MTSHALANQDQAAQDALTWKRMRFAIGCLIALTAVLIFAVTIIT